MCKHCEPNDAGSMEWLRDEPDNSVWLEEYGDDWALVASATAVCCGAECGVETFVYINNCPMCGRELGGKTSDVGEGDLADVLEEYEDAVVSACHHCVREGGGMSDVDSRDNGWYLRYDGYMTSESNYLRISGFKAARALDNRQNLVFVKFMGGKETDCRVYAPKTDTGGGRA